jgi:hypothetical protein
LNWGVIYIIRKFLERRCLKWACMTHLDIWNTSYDQKKGRESNWQFDYRLVKVKNFPDSLACRWRATYRWKALHKGYNFDLNLISIGGLHIKLCAPKVARVPTLGSENPRTKCHLDVSLMAMHKIYYKGEGGGFPQVRAMVSLVSSSCPWLVLAPKVLQLCINQIVFGFVQVRVNNWCLSFFLVPSWNSNTPASAPKCYKPGNVPQLLVLLLFSV